MPVGDTARKLKHDAKVAIQLAFEDLGDRTALVEWANRSDKNLGAFYTQIWCKIIPKDIKTEHVGSDGKPMRMIVAWEEPTTTKTPDE